jgi:hypothetical protein
MAIGFWFAKPVDWFTAAKRGRQRHSCNGLSAIKQIRCIE